MAFSGLSPIEQRVCERVAARADALLEDLRLHVSLPTGGNNTQALDETRELFTQRLNQLGAVAHQYQPDTRPEWIGSYAHQPANASSQSPPVTAVCARLRDGLPRILIAGHLDTVHDPQGSFRSLVVSADKATATGPGCVDMKGGLVIALAALEVLEECGVSCGWSFLMNSDEETGSYFSDTALVSEARAHDVGLALEPALAGGELAIERMGSGQFAIRCTGRSAHVGRSFAEGISAVTALGRCVVAVGEMADSSRGKIANIGPLRGGAVTNAVPDEAWAWGNVRYPTPQIMHELATELDGLGLKGLGIGSEKLPGVEVFRSFNRPAKPLTPSTEKVALLARECAHDLGQRLPFAKTGGVCDGNQLQAAGLPTIDTLGVRGGGLHTPEEWIELASLVERCQLLALTIARISEGRLAL
jgi:glutamate carboxypeptidase